MCYSMRIVVILAISTLLASCASRSQAEVLQGIEASIVDSRLQLYAGCNRISAPIEIDATGKVTLGAGIMTRMACPGPIAEKESAALEFINSKNIRLVTESSGKTVLQNANTQLVLTKREDLSAASTIFIYVRGDTTSCRTQEITQCYWVRDDKNAPWQRHVGEIEGFKPEANVDYRLRIKALKTDHKMRWILDLVVEQALVK